MGTANSILVVSDIQEDIFNFKTKIVLLREIDYVIGSTVNKAVEQCRKNFPDTVVVFVHDKNQKLFELCKAIRLDSLLKNIPIIFVFSSYDEEFLLSSFDAGISDYIILPVHETEIMIKVLWCLKKNEMARDIDKKQMLLKDLGVIDKTTGAYVSKYISRVFVNEIITSQRYKFPIVLMTISLDLRHKNTINDNYLAGIVSKSIRSSDIFGMSENGNFQLILPKTGAKGACAVYERISKSIGENLSISAGLSESFDGMTYESLAGMASSALNEALSRGGNKIIISDRVEKTVQKDSKTSKEWLDKIEANKKDYELFKEEFSKRVSTVIAPVFLRVQSDLKQKYSAKFIVEQFITDTKCYFSIKEPFENVEGLIKIADPGLPKVVVEKTFALSDKHSARRASLEIGDLTEENVLKILHTMFIEFQKLL